MLESPRKQYIRTMTHLPPSMAIQASSILLSSQAKLDFPGEVNMARCPKSTSPNTSASMIEMLIHHCRFLLIVVALGVRLWYRSTDLACPCVRAFQH